MSDKNVLNLDDLIPELSVTLEGEGHQVHYITGEELNAMQLALKREIRAGREISDIEEGIRVLAEMLPSLGEERLRGLPAKQIRAMADFLTPRVLGSETEEG